MCVGHYPDIPVVDRLSLPWRRVIQVAFALQLPVLDNLVACSCGLLLFAMRSCLQWWVQDDAALRQHCYLLFKWQGFEEVVKQTWRAIRQAINAVTPPTLHHLLTESTSLFPVEMMSQINTICDEAHAAVLLTSYKRQRDSITKVIHTCKQVNGSLEFAASDNEDSDNEPKEEDEEQDSSSSTALRVLSPSLLEAIYDWVRCYDPRRITLEQAIFPSMRLLEVHPVAEADMNDLVEEYNEWRLGKRALRARILQFCKKFPYTFAVYQAVCSLWANHACFHMYELPSHYRKYQIQALVEKYLPHVMTKADVLRLPVLLDKIHMLHCVACGCIYTITRVPHSMHRKSRQIHIQQQTRLAFLTRELEHQLQDTSTSEMICGVMGTSLQQEEQARGLHGYAEGARQLLCLDGTQIGFPMTGAGVAPWSIHKGGQFSGYNYIYGYTDCTLDFFTGQVHCKYDRREGHLRCSAQPLKRCSLLGNLVCYRGLITLCPQEGCGLPFLYSAMECVYTERGFACAACSNRILEERWQERIQMWNLPYDLETGHFTSRATCSVCGVTFSQRRTCYLYPHGILLCEYHHTRRTQAYLAKAELLTKEEAHQVLQVASKKIWTKDGYRQGRRKQTTVGTGRKFYTK
jgi:ribosomal protein S26